MKKTFRGPVPDLLCPAVPVHARGGGAGAQRQRTAPVLHGQHLVTIPRTGPSPSTRSASGKGQQPDLEGGAGEPEIRRGYGLG